MSSVPSMRPATYDDLRNAPPHRVAELVDGELFLSPRPASPHAYAASGIGIDVGGRFGRRGGPEGWWILDEPELHLGRPDPRSRAVVPDLAGWRRARLPTLPDVPAFTLAPDWVCEVLSPSTARLDRVVKLRVYAEAEVAWVWLVDPRAHTLEVLCLGETGRYTLVEAFDGDGPVRAPPFDEVALALSGWWLPDSPG